MSWKPETYKASKIDEMIKKKEITTPKYQRGLQWSEQQQLSLIDSIKKGFPFGSILLNKRESANGSITYDIIDGLQRCTTINKFLNNPGIFFKGEDIEDEYISDIYNLMSDSDKGTDRNETEEKIRMAVVEYVQQNLPTMDQVKSIQYHNVSLSLKNKWPSLSPHLDEDLDPIIEKLFASFKKTCTQLSDAEIPAIVYDGDQSLLPEVFERINSRGASLSKYDIYSATWGDDVFDVTDSDFSDLYDFICKRYEEMNNSDIAMSDFDSREYKDAKKITTFDLCYAFGKKLKKEYPNLFGKNNGIEVDAIGFNLINSSLGKPTTDLSRLNTNLKRFQNDIQKLLRCILESCGFVDKQLKVITGFKGNSSKDLPILHSENQIISIVASVFLARYAKVCKDKNDKIASIELVSSGENPDWDMKEDMFKRNIPIIYVQDSLSNVWGGTGDKKLHNVICDSTYYLRVLKQKDFDSVYNSWFAKVCADRNEEKAIKSPTSTDKIILNIYTSQTVTASDAHNGEQWDIEHICPKKIMKDISAKYNSAAVSDDKHLKLPLSSIGNVCYLPSQLNRSKEQKTIYQAGLDPLDLKEVEDKFALTEKDDLHFLFDNTLSSENFKKEYMDFITKRNEKILKYIDEYLFD